MDLTSGRVTLKQIAQETGVSVSTVSLVLRGKASQRRISSEVQRREEYAAPQDYSPNLLVRAVQQGCAHVLSLYNAFNPRDRGDYDIDQVTRAIERAAGAFHYELPVHCGFSRSEEETYRIVSGGLADGPISLRPPQENALLSAPRGFPWSFLATPTSRARLRA